MKKSNNCNVILYFFLLIFTLISLITLRKDDIFNFSPIFLIILFFSSIVSAILMMRIKRIIIAINNENYDQITTSSNDSEKSLEKAEIDLLKQTNNLTDDSSTDNIKFNIKDGIFSKIKIENGHIVLNDINQPNDDTKIQFDFSKDELANFNNSQRLRMLHELEKYNKFSEFCEECKIFKQIRTKHCKKCGVCIEKHDHHCFYFDICVCQRNQKCFLFFLLFQSISLLQIIIIDFDTMSYYLNKTNENYFKVPFVLYPLILIHIGYFLISKIFLILQFFLISTGQTMNEFLRRNTIRYLVVYKELKTKYFASRNERIRSNVPYNPFDFGVIENFKIYFTKRKIDWFDEYKKNLVSLDKRFNICENEYWKCF